MTDLLEMREKIKLFYSRLEVFILPLAKFLLAFVVLNTLNSRMGYMTRLDNVAIVLIVALSCSFLPTGSIVVFAALFSLLHMYSLSAEVALVGFCLYLVMFLLYFRFTPKDSLVVTLTPLFFAFRIPYVVPIAVGLVCGPASMISVGCGVGVYYLLQTVVSSAPAIGTMGEDEVTAKLRLVIDGVLGNREMLVMIAAFVITVLVVYLIRRMSIDYAWTIAMVSGVLLNLVILLIGALIYDIDNSMVGALLGSLLALAVAKIIEFFRFCVDYSRTEKVQFEDDEYYYYVKAVPKMTVAMSTKTVKKINTQQARTAVSGRSSGYVSQGRSAQPAGVGGNGRSAQPSRVGSNGRSAQPSGVGSNERRVVTERTTSGRDRYVNQRGGSRNGYSRGGKSLTIGSTSASGFVEEGSEDIDDSF